MVEFELGEPFRESIGESGSTPTPSASGGISSASGAPSEDPWTRIGDVLAGIQAPGIMVPEPQAQTVTFVPGTGTPWMALLLLLAAAGAAYWWYTQRKGG